MTIQNADITLAAAGRNYDRERAALAVANRRRAAAIYTQDAHLIDGARIYIRRTFQALNKARIEYRSALKSALAV